MPAWAKVRSVTVWRTTTIVPPTRIAPVAVWVTLVAVKNIRTARGTMMMPIVLN
jgi:hypothetical protein